MSSPAGAIRLATSTPLLLMLGAILVLGGGMTMMRYLVDLPAQAQHSGQHVAGDFMAFYTAASMIHAGRGPELYDLEQQRGVQVGLRGSDGSSWQPYVNPPLLGVLLAPLARLPFVPALLAFDAIMVAALAATVLMLRRALQALARKRAWWWATVLLIIGWHPLLRTMLGGQNSVLTLALLTGVYVALRSQRPGVAGVLLGLLTYKPQFAALAMGLLAIQGHWRVVGWAALVAAGHYALAGALCGWDWPVTMYGAMTLYHPLERVSSYATHVALLPASDFALGQPWGRLLAWPCIATVIALLIHYARRQDVAGEHGAALWGLLVAGTMLVSPHLQYYDVGILVLPAVVGLDDLLRRGRQPSAALRGLLAAGYILFPVYTLAETLGFQPLVLWPAMMFMWMLLLLHRSRLEQHATALSPPDARPGTAVPATMRPRTAHTVIVVPCYNEARRLPVQAFREHLTPADDVCFLFVDDGSRDGTAAVIRRLCRERPEAYGLLSLPHNVGKAEAVRQGLLSAFEMKPAQVAFWDADLATPLAALRDFHDVLERHPGIDMVFGARVQLLGRDITRHAWRHYVGRGFATAVSLMLRMPVYDTQCGAKMFRCSPMLEDLFGRPFLSRWLFDVEIIARLARARRQAGLTAAQQVIYELPLQRWTDIAGSKLKWTDFFKALGDLARIYRAYCRG